MSWIKKFYDILLVLAAVLIGFLLSELMVGSFFPQDLSGSWREEHDSGLIVNKSEGTAKDQLGERILTYSFGEYHNRKTEQQERVKKGASKILVLGDSFTFGHLLPNGSTYVDRLQNHFLNEFEIINAAGGGWGTADYAKYIEIFCEKIKPQQIFIYLNFGDIDRSLKSTLYRLNDEGQLELTKDHKKSKLKVLLNKYPLYEFLLENSHLVQLTRKAFLQFSIVGAQQNIEPSRDLDSSLILGKKLFLKIKRDTEQCGAELKVFNIAWEGYILVPEFDWEGLTLQSELDYHTMHFLKETNKERFFYKNGIKFFDLADTEPMKEVIANNERFIIPKDMHPNELGAERIFLATLESLNSQQ